MIIRNKFNGYVIGNNRLYPGGGGGQSQPTNTTQTTTTIPTYAKPYVERMLGKAEAFSETPYQPYGGQRIAEFTPLQEQAFQGAANLGPARQLGTGTQLAGLAGLGGLGAGQQYAQQATNPYAMQSYMSPYIESAMAPAMREAQRSSAIQGQQNQAQAVMQNAFGGARSAIVEAERQRNLQTQLGDIYGKGMQTAFEQARQAQQFGADLGLRGYGIAGQMAGTLGQLGQTQFGQQQGAIQAQAAAGAQQQAQAQQGLTQAYQDFLTQRGYPQQQLAFMSDILRGVPLGQQTQVQYQAPPPMASQLAQLGLGAYGVSQMMKKDGGIIKMAEGGIADAAPSGYHVPPEKLMGMMDKMSTEQLQAVGENAQNAVTLGLVQAEMAKRQAMANGQILAQEVPEGTVKDAMMGIDQVPMDERMFADTTVGEYVPEEPKEEPVLRSGGIVAFAKGKEVKETPAAPDDIAALRAMNPTTAFTTPEERRTNIKAGLQDLQDYLGTDRSVELAEKIAKSSELGPEAESNAKAAAAFEMMQAFGKAVPFATAAGEAGGIAGRNIREYEKLKREAEKEANKMRLETARYERAEKRGNYTEAQKSADRIEDNRKTLYSLQAAQQQKLAEIQQTRESEQLRARTSLQVAEIGAGPGYAAAGKKEFGVQILERETAKGMSDWAAKNPGKHPTPADIATINAEAGKRAANLIKQDIGNINQERLEISRQEKAAKQAAQELDNNAQLARALRKRDKDKGLDPGTSQQEWLRIREREIMGESAPQQQQQQARTIDFSSIR